MRGKGETCCGVRRRGKGGGEREIELLLPRGRSSLGERSFPRERGRKRRKNVEDVGESVE